MDKKDLGAKGEAIAVSLLRCQGYKILVKNFRCRLGEIDIIAQDKDTLVFVEVKTRWSKEFGLPEEAVGKRKLHSIQKVGEYFRMSHKGSLPEAHRIDVVAIEMGIQGKVTRKEIIQNAAVGW
ncbi:MAG: YraN family protein [Candidatus Woykebacteria bacterium]